MFSTSPLSLLPLHMESLALVELVRPAWIHVHCTNLDQTDADADRDGNHDVSLKRGLVDVNGIGTSHVWIHVLCSQV